MRCQPIGGRENNPPVWAITEEVKNEHRVDRKTFDPVGS